MHPAPHTIATYTPLVTHTLYVVTLYTTGTTGRERVATFGCMGVVGALLLNNFLRLRLLLTVIS